MKILNFTNVSITLETDEGLKTLKPLGRAIAKITRANGEGNPVLSGGKVRTNLTKIGNVTGLPEEKEDTIIIVPSIVYNALSWTRDDLYCTDEPIRDEHTKRIIASKSITKVYYYGQEKVMKELASVLKKFIKHSTESQSEIIDEGLDVISKIENITNH
jgi:hypothetical protein